MGAGRCTHAKLLIRILIHEFSTMCLCYCFGGEKKLEEVEAYAEDKIKNLSFILAVDTESFAIIHI
jgi:hypothetical protein